MNKSAVPPTANSLPRVIDTTDAEVGAMNAPDIRTEGEQAARSPESGRVSRTASRAGFAAAVLLTGWILMLARLMQLQAAQRESLHHRVTSQRTFTETVPARPGDILDRSGNVLAMTVLRESIFCVPAEIKDATRFVWTIAPLLSVDAAELFDRISSHPNHRFLWVKRRVTPTEFESVTDADLPEGTWGSRKEYLRRYPQGSLAAHVIGLRDIDNVGRGGLEESMDSAIRGQHGKRVLTRDALGEVVEVETGSGSAPEHGRAVVTTIDTLTQLRAEQVIDRLIERWQPRGACAVVMDPHSGEILAMVSRPTFDPNFPQAVPPNAWMNLAVSAAFEPGSTFKPMIIGWALKSGCLKPEEKISCFHGAYRMGRRILHDHHPYAELSVTDVLVKSSNIGMARIAERLGPDGLFHAVTAFGFGQRTGIEVPGEVTGIVRPRADWDDYSLGSVPMGQEIAATPLQLITAYTAVVNGGTLIRPVLVRQVADDDQVLQTLSSATAAEGSAPVESGVLPRQISEWLVMHPLRQVVERGTGTAGNVRGLSVFGKTGTAQKADPERGGYSDTRHVCSFICGAPSDYPELLVLVTVDEPTAEGSHYGGTVAAPAAAEILTFAMRRLPAVGVSSRVRPEFDIPPEF